MERYMAIDNRYHMGVVRWHPDELNFVYPKKPTDDRT